MANLEGLKLSPMNKTSKSARISMKKSFKVLHLPLDIAGNSQSISHGMNEIGIHSTSFALECGKFEYESDIRWGRAGEGRVRRELLRFLSSKFLFKYDVYCFNGGRTLFSPIPYSDQINSGKKFVLRAYNRLLLQVQKLELKILKIRGCIIIVIYQGDDARQGDFLRASRKYSHVFDVDSFYYSSRNDALKRSQIKFLSGYCDLIYALNPDLLEVLESKAHFLPYAVTIPTVPDTQPRESIDKTLVIGHAPTHQDAKGTKYVIEAVNAMQELGFQVELKLIENLTHSQAMFEYQSADIILDQLLSGWYGAVAVESMLLSKPVICYIAEEDLRNIPTEMAAELPIINATKYNLQLVIKKLLLLSPEERLLLGEKHRDFALKWHSPKSVAKSIYRDIENVR